VTGRLEAHLDNCLTCRSCENVCPANVPFAQVIDAGRAQLRRQRGASSVAVRILSILAARPGLSEFAFRLLRAARAIGIQRLVAKLGFADRSWLLRSMTRLNVKGGSQPLGKTYQAVGDEIGRVSLFTGCVARTLDAETHKATIAVLNAIGYSVTVPAGQTCCGALPLHDGDPQSAEKMASVNAAVFGQDDGPVLFSATGCGVTLREYDRLLDDERGASLGKRAVDVCAFLITCLDRLKPGLRTLELNIALHTPCTARFACPDGDAAYELLSHIPGLTISRLGGTGCCGAAGHHFLTRPVQADALLSPLLGEVADLGPDVVVTSNPGCALHFRGGLTAQDRRVSVVHPVSLIAMSMAST
jgi:glycolate oxidase iron-sulfur subunit